MASLKNGGSILKRTAVDEKKQLKHAKFDPKPTIHLWNTSGLVRRSNFRDMQQQVKERTARVTVSRESSTAIDTLEETVDEGQPTELESGGEFQFETVDELTFGNYDDSDFSDDDYSSEVGVYRTMWWEGLIEE